MNGPARVGIATFELLASGRVRRCLRGAHRRLETLADESDEEIVAAFQRAASAPKLPDDDAGSDPLRHLVGARLGERDAEALALAAEAFSRFPPQGLPQGTPLYDEQLLAATHLMRGALVQMDTGEGKTFALSTAALALLRNHSKVYIVTANPYLAARDAVNTGPIWNALGVSVGLAVQGGREGSDPWRARVVYTTLDDLVFRSLWEDMGNIERLLKWSAVLIDEADAVLLEESTRPYQLIRTTDDPAKDWTRPLQIAAALSDEEVKVGKGLDVSAKLTTEGEARVVALAGMEDGRPADRLLLFREVELAYIATEVVREGHDFEVRDGSVVTMDPNTGWHTPGMRHGWVSPLEAHRGLRSHPHHAVRHFVDGISVLRRFNHLSGASGTIVNEAMDYVLLLSIPPALVAPRRPRREDGLLSDVLTVSRQRAHKWIEDDVVKHGPRRPILIATDSTLEAQRLAERLRASERIEGVRVRPVTDETIAAERVFESAGRPGVTIVSTRAAGRGVDIKLSPEAREAGGAMLLALGHSPEARIDRQLLGRVGREGEPYTAQFVNYPEDSLTSRIAYSRVETILTSLTEDGALAGRPFRRLLANAQRDLRRARLQSFALGVGQGQVRGETVAVLREWRLALGQGSEGELSEEFVSFLAERFMAVRYPALFFGSRATTTAMTAVADGVAEVTGATRAEAGELAIRAAGLPIVEAREVFTRYLEEQLREAAAENEAARVELGTRRVAAERAALAARLADLAESLRGGGLAERGATPALRAALAVAPGAASVPVPASLVKSKLEVLRTALGEAGGDGELAAVLARQTSGVEGGDPWLKAFDPRWSSWAKRSSWSIVSETIDRAAQQMESGLDRVWFRVSQTVNGPRFASAYRVEVEDLRREVEAALATDACANVLAGTDPAKLDDLFSAYEHQVHVDEPRIPIPLPALAPPDPEAAPAVELPLASSADALIAEYAGAMRETVDGEFPSEDALVVGLKTVMGASDLATLVNPDRVAQAYTVWKRSDVRKADIPPWRWRAADRYMRGFFAFLRDRGLAAPMPSGLPQRSRSLLRRAWRRVSSPGLALAAAGLAGAALTALLLALLPPVSSGLAVGVGGEFLDRLLTAGAFSAGSALGPVLFALLGGLWARLLLGLATTSDAGVARVERQTSTLLLLLGSIVLTRPWGGGLGLGVLGSLAIAVLLALAGFSVRNGVYRFEQMTHYHLLPLLGAAFAACSAVPLLVEASGSSSVLALAVFSALLLLASRPLRRGRIRALALLIGDAKNEQPDSMEVSLPVEGRLSVVPHAFALAFAWVTSCVALDVDAVTRSVVAGVTYFLVLGVWAVLLARSVTEVESWRERMRKMQQVYEPSGSATTLEDALAAARRRILAGEMTTVAPIVALATLVSVGAPADLLSRLPLGVATVCAAVIAVDFGMVFVRGLRAPLPGTTQSSSDSFGDELDGTAIKIRGLVAHYSKRMGGAVIAFLVLKELLEVASLGEFIVHLLERAIELF